MKSPILNIDLSGENISGFVESFKYEDSMKKDNILSITIKEDFVLTFLNNQNLQAGAELIFNFGFIGGAISNKSVAIVSDINVDYNNNGISATIKAVDKGHFTKKKTDNKIWQDKTTSQIASEIADKYGFDKFITNTTKVYSNLPQGNLPDFDFLNEITDKENNFVFYIRNNELHFEERGLADNSILTFTFGHSNVILFRPTTKLTKTSGLNSKAEISTFDDEAKNNEDVTVDDTNEEKAVTTTGVYINSDKGILIGEKKIVKGTDDKEEAKAISNNVKKKDALKGTEAVLTIEGIPTLTPNKIITIENVAVRHLGNWLINSIAHQIGTSGYTCTLKLTARGNRTGNNTGTDNNKSVGGNKVDTSKQLKVFRIDSDKGEAIDNIDDL